MNKNNELGKNGEILACRFLCNKGHTLITTNYRTGHKEIDIISLCEDVLVFSEIKTRSNYDLGFPEEAVTLRKQANLKSAAGIYLNSYPHYTKVRFDVISILLYKNKPPEIVHFEDAFY